MSAPLPRFAECKYSVFISYAGADNETYGHWPIDFATILNRQLEAALSPHRHRLASLPEPHAFQLSGIVRGGLEKELRDRIAESYAMVIVVGEGYADSQWCLTNSATSGNASEATASTGGCSSSRSTSAACAGSPSGRSGRRACPATSPGSRSTATTSASRGCPCCAPTARRPAPIS